MIIFTVTFGGWTTSAVNKVRMGTAEILIALGARVEGCRSSLWGMWVSFCGVHAPGRDPEPGYCSPLVLCKQYVLISTARGRKPQIWKTDFVLHLGACTSALFSNFARRFNHCLLFGAHEPSSRNFLMALDSGLLRDYIRQQCNVRHAQSFSCRSRHTYRFLAKMCLDLLPTVLEHNWDVRLEVGLAVVAVAQLIAQSLSNPAVINAGC